VEYEKVGRAGVVETARWVGTLGVPFVVVGGYAIAEQYGMSTKDVDILILVGSWKPLDAALDGNPVATSLSPYSGSIRETVATVGSRRVLVEFISGEQARGDRTADEFVSYVRSRWSRTVGGIRYAEPAAVWYMRLAGDEWDGYLHAFRRDLRAGVPPATFDGALRIGRHLGVEDRTRSRVGRIRELLQLYEAPGSAYGSVRRE
jgi:hypothetical protein